MGHLVSGRFWIYHTSWIFDSIGAKSLPRLGDSLAWTCWASDSLGLYDSTSWTFDKVLKACWVWMMAQTWACWASDRVLGTRDFGSSIHQISTKNDVREEAFGIGTRVC